MQLQFIQKFLNISLLLFYFLFLSRQYSVIVNIWVQFPIFGNINFPIYKTFLLLSVSFFILMETTETIKKIITLNTN